MKSAIKDRMIILSDIHIPYHNKTATKAALDYIKQERPQYVTLNGDIIDFYAVSRYSKDPKRRLQLQDELDAYHDFLDQLRSASGASTQIFAVYGNHEIRWNKYIRDHATEFEGLSALNLKTVLELDKRKIIVAPAGFQFGGCFIVHGDGLFGGKAGYTATKYIDRYMASVVVGHIHRLAIVHRRTATSNLFGMELGTLSSLDPSYEMTGFADWQTGFGSLTRHKNGLIVPTLHQIINNDVY